MNYLIGDLQGCCDALERLLQKLDFSPSRDRLFLLGDLVNRGPHSLATLRKLQSFGDAATCLLGNHDLHLLALACGARKAKRDDTAQEILTAPDRDALLAWLRIQHLAWLEHGWLMVHAGVVPQWSTELTLRCAAEVESILRGPALTEFLHAMYANTPEQWSPDLDGVERLRFIVNVLTRIRFCDAAGRLDHKTKDGAGSAPPGYLPWFDVPGRKTRGQPIAFGHWSTLGLMQRNDLLALDTGCVWGGRLSAARIEAGQAHEIIQVDCAQAQRPGT